MSNPGTFFKQDEDFLKLFEQIRIFISSLGKVNLRTTKTQISFATRRQFAWIWLPPVKVKNRPEKYIVLSFALGEQVKDRRIVQSVEAYPGRWMHHLILANKTDLNRKVYAWIKKAYAFSLSE
jgi:hypothetical protein